MFPLESIVQACINSPRMQIPVKLIPTTIRCCADDESPSQASKEATDIKDDYFRFRITSRMFRTGQAPQFQREQQKVQMLRLLVLTALLQGVGCTSVLDLVSCLRNNSAITDVFEGMERDPPFPIWNKCKDAPCTHEKYRGAGLEGFIPGKAAGDDLDGPDIADAGLQEERAREINCAGDRSVENEFFSKDVFEDGAQSRTPVILRGCAKSFAAFKKWTDRYLQQKSPLTERQKRQGEKHPFAPLWEPDPPEEGFTGDVPEKLKQDIEDKGKLGPILEAADGPTLWTSAGGKREKMHFDTFDSMHVMIAGTKLITLASPKYARSVSCTIYSHYVVTL